MKMSRDNYRPLPLPGSSFETPPMPKCRPPTLDATLHEVASRIDGKYPTQAARLRMSADAAARLTLEQERVEAENAKLQGFNDQQGQTIKELIAVIGDLRPTTSMAELDDMRRRARVRMEERETVDESSAENHAEP
jgi:putative protein kinase ArgK-like GTPase of G3E family